jgi:hypothetical protein
VERRADRAAEREDDDEGDDDEVGNLEVDDPVSLS